MGASREDFCKKMEHLYLSHSVYIATGNGELTTSLTIKQIHGMEKDYGVNVTTNTARDLQYIAKCYRNGYDMSESRACDCSGAIVWALRELNIITPKQDYRAKDFQKISKVVSLKNLKAGDLVFDKPSDATHVGVFVGNNKVIESKGRDYGVVKRALSDGNWASGGQLPYFSDDPEIQYYKQYKGTSTSIVDALRAVGEKDTSFEHRQRIAVANKFVESIDKWKGTAAQNLLMLDVLKKGALIKCP